MRCGWCDGIAYAEYVNIGVGAQQVDAGRCGDCGAQQISLYHECDTAPTPEESRRGWWMGEDTEAFMIHLVDTGGYLTRDEWVRSMIGYLLNEATGYRDGTEINVVRMNDGLVHQCKVYSNHDAIDDRTYRYFEAACTKTGFRLAGSGPRPAPTCLACIILS